MITLSNGTTVDVKQVDGDQVVILDNPQAPDNMRNVEAGRIVDFGGASGFQPAPFALYALRPEALRVIAGLVEGETV